ncbi:MAG: 2-amino-4-hydroxy-6-hydroxymethyldihydropteridine diphosphokinase [Succinivibrio sp.]|nr:2-amino-4-hydroxy-6-hydroxymethyldihydropteridine diphosphokinase [Succinivibrio sp.]
MSTKVYLGVGSNLNREHSLRFAFAKISPLLKNCKKSSIWISKPVRNGEPDYFNMVISGDTESNLEEFHACLMKIEEMAGKEVMINNGTNFGMKRRLDIDILAFGDLETTTPCIIPRHDIQDYPFVTCPLNELDPDFVHPVLHQKVSELWAKLEPTLSEDRKVVKTSIDWNVEAPSWNNAPKD